ncbi:MAG: hypothetical protein C4562_02355 [Actinobacteria bacterium]|nr:MAG: hypothetical protein C4562_02355 [Actinomycetota bacterium]
MPDMWKGSGLSGLDGRSTEQKNNGKYSFKIAGNKYKSKMAYQSVDISGNSGDSLVFSGFNKVVGPVSSSGLICAKVVIRNTDGTNTTHTLSWPKSRHDWMLGDKTIATTKPYSKATVYLYFSNQPGTCYFDNFKLEKASANYILEPSFELDTDIIDYVYDGEGKRFSKTIKYSSLNSPSIPSVIARRGSDAAISVFYHYDVNGNIVSEDTKTVPLNGAEETKITVRYIRDDNGKALSMIQQLSSNNEQRTFYFLYNGHGDVTSLTDSTGAVVATYSYDEFGNLTSSTDNVYNPLRYSGANNAYYDSETSMYKMGCRYYMPEVGRWLTRDSYKGDREQPLSINKYVYVENNPLTNVDPTGFWKHYAHKRLTRSAALQLGFKSKWATYMGKKSQKFDFDPFYNPIASRHLHFNMNQLGVPIGQDSRQIFAESQFNDTTRYLRMMNTYKHVKLDKATPAFKIGYGLHPIQDIYAHHNLSWQYHLVYEWPDIPSKHKERCGRDCYNDALQATKQYLIRFKSEGLKSYKSFKKVYLR